MKRLTVLMMALVLLLTASTACAGSEGPSLFGDDPIALTVNGHDVTQSELKSAATLYLFEATLRCAGYGYGFDMLARMNILDEMDKLLFDLECRYVSQDLAADMGLFPLSEDAMAAAEENADEAWEEYCRIARSENARPFLPAGIYQHIEGDPEGNLIRYFASFGLTKEALLEAAIPDQADEELEKEVTAFMADRSYDEILNYYVDWFLQKMDEQYIVEHTEVIEQVMEELAQDPSENQGDDDFDAYERSILIEGYYYTLGESTIRDFEQNGWSWTRMPDGRFCFEVTEEGNYFYARTDNNQPGGKLIMVDMFYAYEISYEYLGFGFDIAYDPDADSDIYTYLCEIYEGDFTDDGILFARTAVTGGTLLIEVGEWALRLTLE